MQTDKKIIQATIEAYWIKRVQHQNLRGTGKKALDKELDAQSHFVSGVMAALQTVFGENDGELTDYVKPFWVIAVMSDRRIIEETSNDQG